MPRNVTRFPESAQRSGGSSKRAADEDEGLDPGLPDPGEDLHHLPQRHRRGIYLLPNSFTAAALFAGFYAIVMAMAQRYDLAATAIFAAMVLDSLDGRVARLTHTQSEFGAQFDSLADMVSFGAAPALIMYQWSLHGLGKLGWLAAFVYCAGAALRLARFNTNIGVVDKNYFQGLPSPAAAALVAGFIWIMSDASVLGTHVPWVAFAITAFAGVTMVTNVPFYSFKAVSLRRSVPFITMFLIVLLIGLIAYRPPLVLFGLFVLYALSGYVLYAWRRFHGKTASVISTSTDEPDERGLHG
ncbi:MAG: CDP-diacylglycerol--serine O-phosphatidyltransferase [Betaproteobacteria bacterium]|nr:CDP-diacylglycerol--serine O-phosphatidyltransferase [Betaproteobacteria bacterium]MDE2124476.1 CDP-diacylglycerol--serine O-phosphatidyltransferase [Betaproteobacteria bacterium]MDE2185782.1 CDP-diacylglycerol--serine O-phosphatidyltransferase [Betaproteobacteria bacterium]